MFIALFGDSSPLAFDLKLLGDIEMMCRYLLAVLIHNQIDSTGLNILYRLFWFLLLLFIYLLNVVFFIISDTVPQQIEFLRG